MRRRFAVAAAALALSAALTVPAYAGTWKYVNDQWKYQKGTNKFAYNEWIKDNGKYYYIGNDGIMKTGWQQVYGKWYYLGSAEDGSMKTYWQQINGKWYFFGFGSTPARSHVVIPAFFSSDTIVSYNPLRFTLPPPYTKRARCPNSLTSSGRF